MITDPRDTEIDDLGFEGGSRFFEFGAIARRVVCSWIPEALGNRPLDWAVRDLLVGGAFRDRRNWPVRALIKNQHPQFFDDTLGFPELHRKQIARCRAFQFFQAMALLRIAGTASAPAQTLVDQLLACPPNLFLLQREPTAIYRNCKFSKLCPYCLARTAVDVYSRIDNWLTRSEPSLLALITLTEDTDLPDPLSDEGYARRNLQGLWRARRHQLREIARSIGASGGLITNQLGLSKQQVPKIEDGELVAKDEYDFSARSALLLQLPNRFIVRLRDLGLDDPDEAELDHFPMLDDLRSLGEASVRLRLNWNRDGLRSLIFGESPGMYLNSVEPDGIDGVFAYAQLHLAHDEQWMRYRQLTKHSKNYILFGSWSHGRRPPKAPFRNVSERSGHERQRQPLRVANWRRSEQAFERDAALIEQVRPIAVELQRQLGRRSGRTCLRRACSDAGIRISERQLRRVIRRLEI